MQSQTIELHFKEIMSLASRIKELKRKLSTLVGEEMMQIINSIQVDWNSECADVLTGKEVKIVPIMHVLHLQETINRIQKKVQQLAQKRGKYGIFSGNIIRFKK